jgi:LTXXQ motif family protein
MRSLPILVMALGLTAGAAQAQDTSPRRPAAPPDHWLTIDSISQAVGLTEAQRPDFVKHYDALNAVMKKAADERVKMREAMGGERPTPEQMQEMRTKFGAMQTELDAHYDELRKLLTEEQQPKFDALEKPRVAMGARRPGG